MKHLNCFQNDRIEEKRFLNFGQSAKDKPATTAAELVGKVQAVVEKTETPLPPEEAEKVRKALEAIAQQRKEVISRTQKEEADLLGEIKANLTVDQKLTTEEIDALENLTEEYLERAPEDQAEKEKPEKAPEQTGTLEERIKKAADGKFSLPGNQKLDDLVATFTKAIDAASKKMTPEQRAELENYFIARVKAKAGEGKIKPGDADDLFKEIWEQAEKIKEANPATKQDAKAETPEAKMEAAKQKLKGSVVIAEWANERTEDKAFKSADERMFSAVEKHKDVQPLLELIASFAQKLSIDPESLKKSTINLIALNTSWFSEDVNQKKVQGRIDLFQKTFEENLEKANDFFKLRRIPDWKTNTDLLVRYFTFNNVESDIKAFQEFDSARVEAEKEKPGTKIEVEEDENKAEVEEAEDEAPFKKSAEKAGAAGKAFKESVEAFQKGEIWEGIAKLFEAIGKLIGSWLSGVVDFFKYIATKIPPSAANIPIIGPLIAKLTEKTKTAEKDEEDHELAPIALALGVTAPADLPKVKELGKIKTEELLAMDPKEVPKLVTDRQINLSSEQITLVQGKLLAKQAEIAKEDQGKSVLRLLKKYPELLA